MLLSTEWQVNVKYVLLYVVQSTEPQNISAEWCFDNCVNVEKYWWVALLIVIFFNISKFSENHKQKITFCLFDWFILFGSYFKQMLNWFIRKHISYRYAVFFYRFFFPVKGIIFRPSYFRVNNVLFSPLPLRVTSKLNHSKCQPSIWHIHNCNHILRTIIMFKCMKASVYP